MQISHTTPLPELSDRTLNRLNNHGSEDRPAILLLTDDGLILESNLESEKLLGLSAHDFNKKHISRILPFLKKTHLLSNETNRVNPYLRFLSRINHKFRVISLNGNTFFGELYFSDIDYLEQYFILIMIYPVRH